MKEHVSEEGALWGTPVAAESQVKEHEHVGEHALHWETSPWPFILSIGLLLTAPLAFAFYFVYDKPGLTVLTLGVGVPLTIISIAGWISEAVGPKQAPPYSVAAMPIFIIAEAFIFIALFISYWMLRLKSPFWPPAGTPEISKVTPIIMTIILVSSSFTIHYAEVLLERKERSGFLRWLIVSIVLGGTFLGLSINEYSHLFHEGFNFRTNGYSTAFYSITGFHASHVFVGIGMFISMLIPALMGRISKNFVKASSMYWHFVDIIWFFVVSQVYFW